MRLPVLVRGNKGAFLFFLIGGFSTILLYQFTNRVHFFEPQILGFAAVDQALPFMPWTVWIYFTEYLIFIVSWALLNDDMERTKYFYSYMAILLVSALCFVIWPTTFPRDQYPLNTFEPTLSVRALHFFRTFMDTPANCVPSLHVSSCYIAALVFLRVSKKKFIFFFIWATAVAVSTMTTKQHYFLDVWTAAILVSASYVFFYSYVEYYALEKNPILSWARKSWCS